jgi:hypothetical protein
MDDKRAAPIVASARAGLLHHRDDSLDRSRRADGADGARVSLAVDDAPYVKYIRDHVITLITPIVEVDGRDRVRRRLRMEEEASERRAAELIYWGTYVAHDNNRDAMGVTLKLTQNVLNTYVDSKAQVLHDLHESVAYLYDNTIGDGPYNAWLDPL